MRLDDGTVGDVWSEDLHLAGAEAVASYVDGPVPGVTGCHAKRHGRGTAWYLATRLDQAGIDALVGRVLVEAGVDARRPAGARPGSDPSPLRGRTLLGLPGQSRRPSRLEVAVSGRDLVSSQRADGLLSLGAGAVAVVEED